jgi:hypothetical protein
LDLNSIDKAVFLDTSFVFLTKKRDIKYFEDGLFKKFNLGGLKFNCLLGMRQTIYALSGNLLVIIDFETINYKLASEYQIFEFNFEICDANLANILSLTNYLCLPLEFCYTKDFSNDLYMKSKGSDGTVGRPEQRYDKEISLDNFLGKNVFYKLGRMDPVHTTPSKLRGDRSDLYAEDDESQMTVPRNFTYGRHKEGSNRNLESIFNAEPS